MKILSKNTKRLEIGIHLLVWIILFSMPYFLSSGTFENKEHLLEHTWIPLVYYAIIFYINYFYLGDILFNKKKRLPFFLINTSIILFFLFINGLLRFTFFHNEIPPIMLPRGFSPPPISFFVYKDVISYLIPVIFCIAVKATERWAKVDALQKDAERERLSSELQHLRYQLQPHFFFNSLNNIYALVDLNPEQAKESIHTLSKLMRYMLYESDTDKVSLAKEISFMKRYIDLMQMRISDKTSVSYHFPKVNVDVQIAPLLFISLIENAFKHGVSASKKTEIQFNMILTDTQLSFVSENVNLPKQDNDKSGSGIGLDNLRRRLRLLYPHKHILTQKVLNENYWCELTIDISK